MRMPAFMATLAVQILAMGCVHAQGVDFMSISNSYAHAAQSTAATTAMNSALDRHARSAAGTGRSQGPGRAGDAAALRFSPSRQAERDASARMVDLLSSAAPAQRAQLEAELGSGRLHDAYRQLMRSNGLDSANLGDVVAAYYLVMWQVAHDRVASPTEVAAARAQLVPNLLGNPSFARGSERDKQETAANLSLLTMLAFASYQEMKSRSDTAGLRQLQDSIFQAMQQQGVDLRAVTLTSNGFASR